MQLWRYRDTFGHVQKCCIVIGPTQRTQRKDRPRVYTCVERVALRLRLRAVFRNRRKRAT